MESVISGELYLRGLTADGSPRVCADVERALTWPRARMAYDFAQKRPPLREWRVGHRKWAGIARNRRQEKAGFKEVHAR